MAKTFLSLFSEYFHSIYSIKVTRKKYPPVTVATDSQIINNKITIQQMLTFIIEHG